MRPQKHDFECRGPQTSEARGDETLNFSHKTLSDKLGLAEMKLGNFSHKTLSDKLVGILGEDLWAILHSLKLKNAQKISPNSSPRQGQTSVRVINICHRNFALGKVSRNLMAFFGLSRKQKIGVNKCWVRESETREE